MSKTNNSAQSTDADSRPSVERRAFVSNLMGLIPDALIVTGLGSAAYDVFASGDRDLNYYLWGAMGGASAIGLGLALAQPEKSVVVMTGDGEQLMGIGSLATIGAKRPMNLTIVVLDNGHFGETGMQRSHTSLGTDLVAVAKGFGITNAWSTHSIADVTSVALAVRERRAVTFVQAFIEANEPPRVLPPRDGSFIKNRFRSALGFPPF